MMSDTIDFIAQPLITLLSVLVGGFLSYKTQLWLQDRKKEKIDEQQKYKAYNTILFLNGEESPLIINIYDYERNSFDSSKYHSLGIRETLYSNLHLFSSELVKEVLYLDNLGDEAEVMGSDPEHEWRMASSYSKIVKLIKEDYNFAWNNAKKDKWF